MAACTVIHVSNISIFGAATCIGVQYCTHGTSYNGILYSVPQSSINTTYIRLPFGSPFSLEKQPSLEREDLGDDWYARIPRAFVPRYALSTTHVSTVVPSLTSLRVLRNGRMGRGSAHQPSGAVCSVPLSNDKEVARLLREAKGGCLGSCSFRPGVCSFHLLR
jgi:hypothetical protein